MFSGSETVARQSSGQAMRALPGPACWTFGAKVMLSKRAHDGYHLRVFLLDAIRQDGADPAKMCNRETTNLRGEKKYLCT